MNVRLDAARFRKVQKLREDGHKTLGVEEDWNLRHRMQCGAWREE